MLEMAQLAADLTSHPPKKIKRHLQKERAITLCLRHALSPL
jgi:hypothetical protein